jgi:uncharacterized membrane protein YkvA (DUF1232 family)
MARRSDPFPRERFGALVGRLPRYARLAYSLGRSDRLSRGRRAALIAGAAYLVSPIDLVPGIIPVAGQLDDAAAVIIALRVALRGLPDEERVETLAAAGLDARMFDEDLRTIGATYAWLARQGGRLMWRAARGAVGLSGRLLGRLSARVERGRKAADRP